MAAAPTIKLIMPNVLLCLFNRLGSLSKALDEALRAEFRMSIPSIINTIGKLNNINGFSPNIKKVKISGSEISPNHKNIKPTIEPTTVHGLIEFLFFL